MKIVVIGGSGRIGTKLVSKLRQLGHDVVGASRSTGVNLITGEGLKEVLSDTQVVVDVAESPYYEEKAVLEFFETSARNLLAAEKVSGVKHHVALSVVGVDRPQVNPYFRAKLAQEKLVKESGISYSILRATQFFEFIDSISQAGTIGQTVHVSTAAYQPIAADDVAAALADISTGSPLNNIVEIAGPGRAPMDTFVRQFLTANQDTREVIGDEHASFFGAEVTDQSLVPGDGSRTGSTSFSDWLNQSILSTVK